MQNDHSDMIWNNDLQMQIKKNQKRFSKTTGEDTALNTHIWTWEYLGNPSRSWKSEVAAPYSSPGVTHMHMHRLMWAHCCPWFWKEIAKPEKPTYKTPFSSSELILPNSMKYPSNPVMLKYARTSLCLTKHKALRFKSEWHWDSTKR